MQDFIFKYICIIKESTVDETDHCSSMISCMRTQSEKVTVYIHPSAATRMFQYKAYIIVSKREVFE